MFLLIFTTFTDCPSIDCNTTDPTDIQSHNIPALAPPLLPVTLLGLCHPRYTTLFQPLWECMITVASVSFICNRQGTNSTVPYRVTIHLTKTFPNSLGLPRDTVEGYTFHPPSLLISSVTPKLSHLNFIKWERCQARFQPTKQANSSCSRQARDFKILVIAMSISVVWPNIMSLLWQQIIYYLPRK